MPEVLQNLIPYLVGGMLVFAALLFVIALWNFRRGRREPYWRLRRAASLHGWDLFLISIVLVFLASGVCVFSGLAQAILGPAVAAPAVSPVLAVQPRDTATGVSTTPGKTATAPPSPYPTRPSLTPTGPASDSILAVTANVTPTPAESPTPTQTPARSTARPTVTPTPSPEALFYPTVESSVTPPADAALRITALDSEVTDGLQPVAPGTVFKAGTARIYFWLEYTAMIDGAAWRRVLYRDGRPIQGGAYLWTGGESGQTVNFFGDAAGFSAGVYEVRVFLGEREAARATFTVEQP